MEVYIVYVMSEPEGMTLLEVFANKEKAFEFEKHENLRQYLVDLYGPEMGEKFDNDKSIVKGFSTRELKE